MERPQNINNKHTAQAVRLIIIFHLVGLVGLSIPLTKSLFLQLVPAHLLLMMLILFFSHHKVNTKFLLFFVLVVIAGFAVEWVGVHTGKLFGNYSYGSILGIKLSGIPLIIGINWFLLIYATGVSLNRGHINSMWLRIPAGALVLVLLDRLIEPVAMKFGYWHWAGNAIPDKNYVCWFMVSAVFLLMFELFKFNRQSIVGPVLLVSQFVFFLALLLQI